MIVNYKLYSEVGLAHLISPAWALPAYTFNFTVVGEVEALAVEVPISSDLTQTCIETQV